MVNAFDPPMQNEDVSGCLIVFTRKVEERLERVMSYRPVLRRNTLAHHTTTFRASSPVGCFVFTTAVFVSLTS